MKQKLLLLSLLVCALFISSCGSDDAPSLTIEEYVALNNLTTQVTNTGMHVIIHEAGTEERPTVSSNITINYEGYLLNGNGFDSGNDVTFPLSNLILGWQQGIPLIGAGGSITLLIPASLAYGSRGSGSIPPNTPIGFEIDLISFN